MNITCKRLYPHALVLTAVLVLSACSTAPVLPEGEDPIEPSFDAARVLIAGVETPADLISDPWEGFNRTMYRFNYRFDKYVFLPAVNGRCAWSGRGSDAMECAHRFNYVDLVIGRSCAGR